MSNGVSYTVLALRAGNKKVGITQVLDLCFSTFQPKFEAYPSPLSTKRNLLEIIIDNKPRNSMNSSIVTANACRGGVNNFKLRLNVIDIGSTDDR